MRRSTFTFLVAIIFSITISVPTFAESRELSTKEKKEIRKERKAIRKAERKAFNKALHEAANKALNESDFVLQAHTLYSKRGYSKHVSDDLNFISVEGDKAVLQLAFKGYGGPNGLGGITLKGNVTKKKYSTDKHGNQYLNFYVMGAVLNAEVRIVLNGSDNNADAYVNATTSGGRIQFRGNLVPTANSRVYKSGLEI